MIRKAKKDTKKNYQEAVKLVKKAKIEAEKFIKANKHIDPQLRSNYL